MARYVLVKEEHAELVKREVRVIFGDYFKKEHIEKYPELPGLVHKIMQLGSKAARRPTAQAALDLLNGGQPLCRNFLGDQGHPDQASQSALQTR